MVDTPVFYGKKLVMPLTVESVTVVNAFLMEFITVEDLENIVLISEKKIEKIARIISPFV